MENNKSTNSQGKSQKPKSNKMKKMGKSIGTGIKNTFIEMSESLAGWIDDASMQLNKKGKQSKKQNATSQDETQKIEKPQLEKC